MCKVHCFVYLALLLNALHATLACKGCISVDEFNIQKIVPKFKAVLLKFDIAYPYGDKHDVFTKFAEEVTGVNDLIVAEVGVKDYGDKENADLAKKYGIQSKEDLPRVKLFLQSLEEPVTFANEFTVGNLRDFVRDNTDLYLGLPGCIEKFDVLAKEFVTGSNRNEKYSEVQRLAEKVSERERSSVQTYLIFMKKIVENGIAFVKQEHSRLSKILKEGKLNEKKKEELSERLNILHSFKVNKEEL